MNEIEFVYWLQGFLELSNTKTLNKKQLEMVKKHLTLVLTKVTDVNSVIKKLEPISRPKRSNPSYLNEKPTHSTKYC